MNGLRSMLLAGLLLQPWMPAMADPAQSPFLGGFLQESRVVYPLHLDGWEADAEHRYEQPEEGASVNYRDPDNPGALLSVYFYPAGVLPAGQLEQLARHTLDGIAALADDPRASYDKVETGRLAPVKLPARDGETAPEAWLATMRIESGGQAFDSALGLMVKDLYFIKLRLSMAKGKTRPVRLRREMQGLLRELAGRTRIVSTGDCWNPLPLVARERLDPAAEGALLNMSTEGGGASAVAFADRVEALDTGSSEALVVQALASALLGRIAPGCVMPQDIDPEVAEGMRELRLEYRRAPAAKMDAAAVAD